MVDGAARPGSVLTLSHWPRADTAALARDLSAEIVLDLQGPFAGSIRSASRSSRLGAEDVLEAAAVAVNRAEAATSDHFDEDGLAALFGLVNPEAALGAAELLVGVASCGDFGVVRSDVSARICFAIGPLATAEAAAKGRSRAVSLEQWEPASGGRAPQSCTRRYSQAAGALDVPERFERCWAEDWAALLAGRAALEKGAVTIEEYADVDLAVSAGSTGRRAGRRRRMPTVRRTTTEAAAAIRMAAASMVSQAPPGTSGRCSLRHFGQPHPGLRWRAMRALLPIRELGPGREPPVPSGPTSAARARAERGGSVCKPLGGKRVGALVARVRPVTGRTEIDPALIVTTVRATWPPHAGVGSLP